MNNIWRAIQFIPEYRGRLTAILVVGVAFGLIGTATPYIYKGIVDVISRLLSGALSYEEASYIVFLLLSTFIALRLGVVLLGAIQKRQADDLWLGTVSTFRQRVFDNMTRKSIDYFERTRVGEIMDRFGNIITITMWLSSLTEGVLANILQMIFIVIVLLFKAPLVGVIMVGVLLLNFWISYRTIGWTKPYRKGWQEQAGRMAGLLAEMVGNIATVRSFGGEDFVKKRYDSSQAKWKVQRDKLHKTQWKSEQALNLINTLAILASVSFIVYGALRGKYTVGDILLVLTLTQSLISTVEPIARQVNQAGEIESAAERLIELLDVASEQPDQPDAQPLAHIESIRFDNVSFRYPGSEDFALRQVSFEVRAGETLALVGGSGSGKSTIVKLLMRFYDPTEGCIYVNGRDLREYQQQSLRALMGIVLQDVALFNDSIGENIAFAKPGASEEDIHRAAEFANAHAFIQRLERGYDTLVGERGIKLSGGEKQRVAIARAILKDPQLIILDEATSALDSESEQLVQKGLEKLMDKRTSVVIAHRLSTIMNADTILVVRHGRIVEQGSHADLAKRPQGAYAHLLELQTYGGKAKLVGNA
jgi:ABC-type multidrug transport system fused ATPase/permease subunit